MRDETTQARPRILRRVGAAVRILGPWRLLLAMFVLALGLTPLVVVLTDDRSSLEATARRLAVAQCLGQLLFAILLAWPLLPFLSRWLAGRPAVRRALQGATLGFLGVSLVAGL